DSLANASLRFTNFYASPRCSPTRAALMTGRHAEKTGVFHVTDGGYSLAAEETTMAEYFKAAGYRTGIFGKWHIGDHYPYLPEDQGFDYSLIHKGGAVGQLADHPDNYWDMTKPLAERKQCYFNPTLYQNKEVIKTEGYIADVLTDHAVQFIEDHQEGPFFVYLPYSTPHDPYQVPQKYLDLYKGLPATDLDTTNGGSHRLSDYEAAQYVYAMMTNMDDNIRRILQKLRELDLQENTVIVFLSDNGPAQYRYNGNFRGKKGTLYEGGIRVPAYINYAGLEPGAFQLPAAHYDILPTLAAICKLKVNEKMDGVNLLATDDRTLQNRSVFIRESNYMQPYKEMMVRKGDYKLVALQGGQQPKFQLFNLKADPYEENDLQEQQPQQFNELKNELDHWYDELLNAENLKILPSHVGTEYENPVRLSRHELVNSYSSGWFSKNYLGYYLLQVASAGRYDFRLTFKDTIQNPGKIEIKIGPVGREVAIEQVPITTFTFEDVQLKPGEQVLQTWFQNKNEVISPFYVEIEKR
ncbi:MAG: sulfatase-like hydrolase/transferase, partial [Prolixibacteraceae bacterium]